MYTHSFFACLQLVLCCKTFFGERHTYSVQAHSAGEFALLGISFVQVEFCLQDNVHWWGVDYVRGLRVEC